MAENVFSKLRVLSDSTYGYDINRRWTEMSCTDDSEMCIVTVDDDTMTTMQLINTTTSSTDGSDKWLRVTMATVAVTAIIVTIVLGNTLVIIAIAADRRLKGVQSYRSSGINECDPKLLMKTTIVQSLLRFAGPIQTGNDLQEDSTTQGSEPLNRI